VCDEPALDNAAITARLQWRTGITAATGALAALAAFFLGRASGGPSRDKVNSSEFSTARTSRVARVSINARHDAWTSGKVKFHPQVHDML
jgi:hypothetical protein